MYCMPQVGTKAALYLGSGNEAQGVVSGCIRTNGASCEGTGSPEKKGFCSEHGKGMSPDPQSMGMDGGEAGKLYDGGRERNASGKQRESAPAGKRGNPPWRA